MVLGYKKNEKEKSPKPQFVCGVIGSNESKVSSAAEQCGVISNY